VARPSPEHFAQDADMIASEAQQRLTRLGEQLAVIRGYL
jgi:hypothetical protein